MYEEIKKQAAAAAAEICEAAKLREGQILVVGCSSSEICGKKIGSESNVDVAKVTFEGIYEETSKRGIFLAAQCCEHLNRAIIVDRKAVNDDQIVNVVPFPKAGGSFATAAYAGLEDAVAVEEIRADAGLDIGDTLIGMHMKRVAVPVRLENNTIGEARVVAARVRPKFIGGERAHYNDELK